MPESKWVDLMRPAPGIVRCAICFEARAVEDLLLERSTGMRWDICAGGLCAEQAGLGSDGARLVREPGETTGEAEDVAARYARALAAIVAVLGPTKICSCDFPEECGLPEEADEALRLAQHALRGTPQL